jgi:hypothetical protein
MKITIQREDSEPTINVKLHSHEGAMEMEQSTIDEWIKEGIKEMRRETSRQFWYAWSGNTMVLIHRTDDDWNGQEAYSIAVLTPRESGEAVLR